MKTQRQVREMRDQLAQQIIDLQAPAQDDGDVPEERAAKIGRLQFGVDLLSDVLEG